MSEIAILGRGFESLLSALSVVVNKALNRLPPVIVRSICAELLCRIDCVPQPNHVRTVVNRSAHVIAVWLCRYQIIPELALAGTDTFFTAERHSDDVAL